MLFEAIIFYLGAKFCGSMTKSKRRNLRRIARRRSWMLSKRTGWYVYCVVFVL